MRFLAFVALLALPGCSVFESIVEGLGNFVDENDDGPVFAYVVATEPPRIRLGAITPGDRGIVLSGEEMPEFFASPESIDMSPTNAYVVVNYSILRRDISDYGFNIFSARPMELEYVETDNTVGLEIELACLRPELTAPAETAIREFLTVVHPDTYLPAMTVNVVVTKPDDSNNVLFFGGWSDDAEFATRAEFYYRASYTVPELGITEEQMLPPDTGFWPMPIATDLVYRRNTDGGWSLNACPAVLPPLLPRREPVREITLNDGVLSLDGETLRGSLPADSTRPFELNTVVEFDGAY